MAHNDIQKCFDLDTVFTLKTVKNAIISSTTTVTGTPNISMQKSHSIAFVICTIDATLAGIVTAKVFQATGSTTGTKTTTNLTSTTFATGTPGAGKIKVLEIEASQLDVANGYAYVTLSVKTAGGDSVAAFAIRGPNRYDPASLI
jgi:hypothetical protein